MWSRSFVQLLPFCWQIPQNFAQKSGLTIALARAGARVRVPHVNAYDDGVASQPLSFRTRINGAKLPPDPSSFISCECPCIRQVSLQASRSHILLSSVSSRCSPANFFNKWVSQRDTDSLVRHGCPHVLVVLELGAVEAGRRHLLYAGHRRLQPAPRHRLEPRHRPGELPSAQDSTHLLAYQIRIWLFYVKHAK